MKEIPYYPLGSIVRVEGQAKRLMIVCRGMTVKHPQEGNVFFDYGGVEYPDGLTGPRVCYFNHDAVRELVFRGFEDAESDRVTRVMNQYVQGHPELKRIRV